jgi:hypothetical protein
MLPGGIEYGLNRRFVAEQADGWRVQGVSVVNRLSWRSCWRGICSSMGWSRGCGSI